MARSLLRHTVTDAAGNVIQNALCNIYQQGTTTAVTDLFTGLSGGSPVSTLTSNAQGEVVGWLTDPKLVDIQVTDNTRTAYYPSSPSNLLTWTAFTETVAVSASDASAPSGLSVATVHLSSADLLALNTIDPPGDYATSTVKTIVPSPGPGKAIIPIFHWWFYTPGTTPYTTFDNQGPVWCGITTPGLWDGGPFGRLWVETPSAKLLGTLTKRTYASASTDFHDSLVVGDNYVDDTAKLIDQPLVFQNDREGQFTDGDGTLDVSVLYCVSDA